MSGDIHHKSLLLALPPRKLTYSLQINGWKMKFPFEMVPFWVYMFVSEGGGQIALTDLRHLEHARELFKKWGFRRIEDGKLRTSFIFVGTNHSPPGNHHIPPEEKENHLQMCLGWGYVGSVEGRFLGNQILMGHILSLTRSCGRCVAFAYVQGRLQVIYIYLLREYMFPLWLEDLLTRTNIVKPT